MKWYKSQNFCLFVVQTMKKLKLRKEKRWQTKKNAELRK